MGWGVDRRLAVNQLEELVHTEVVGHVVVVDKLEKLVRMAAVK